MKLKKLTPKQESQLIPFRDKCLEIGLSCEPLDFEKAKIAIRKVYKSAKLKPPKYYFHTTFPLAGHMFYYILSKLKEFQNKNQVRDQVRNQVWNQVRNQVWNQVANQVWNQVENQVWNQVENQVWNQVANQVANQVRNQVRNQVWNQVRNQVRNNLYYYCYGSHSISWLSFYWYFLEICTLKCCEPLRGLIELSQHCGWWLPFKDFVILQDRHCELHRNESGELHHDSKMAIKYPDGWGLWRLNGITVPEWLVTTKEEDLDPKIILKEENAEVRREMVRKIGIDRICYKLGKSVDKLGDYELLLLDLGDNRSRPYLKMLNPSIDTWHVEGVHPDCKTVREALNWRNQTEEIPEVLT